MLKVTVSAFPDFRPICVSMEEGDTVEAVLRKAGVDPLSIHVVTIDNKLATIDDEATAGSHIRAFPALSGG